MCSDDTHALHDKPAAGIQQQIADLHNRINAIPRRVDGVRLRNRVTAFVDDHPLASLLMVAGAALLLAVAVAMLLRRRR